MYNILIVDDEIGITEGLKIIIQRGIPECNIMGVAYNGSEGFDYAMEMKPDIILTDIRMPQADGLEMIHKLRGAGSKAIFIILSGYSEFEYAKKAITLGVKFYINKPVEEEELYEVMNKVFLDIEAERARTLRIRNLENTVQNNMKSIKEFVLRDILDSAGDAAESIKYMLESCGFPISHKQYVCTILELNCETSDLSENILSALMERITAKLSAYSNTVVLRYSAMQTAIILSHHEQIDYGQLAISIGDINSEIAEKWGISATAGIGLVYEDVDGISKSFEEACQALSYKVIKGADTVILYTEIQKVSGSGRVVSEGDIDLLEACLDANDIQGCSQIIDKIFEKMAGDKHLSLMDLQIQCMNILLSGIRKMSVSQLHVNEFVGKNILSLESITRFKTLEQLKNWLTNTIRAIIELKLVGKVPAKKDIITEIKEYVANHFDKEISLAELSERFFINPYYLSQLFKEKTGDTYLSYLTKVRINKAKELLASTSLKVYEICEMVGYSDTNYFSKLFEKFAGCKPTEFKKKQGEKKT
jgi:two-component system response regulator YesN